MKILDQNQSSVFNKYCPEAYCLRLRGFPEREQRIENTIQKSGLNIKYFDGVPLPQVNGFIQKSLKQSKLTNCTLPGEIGATLSHLSVISMANLYGWERVAIFEDDIKFHNNFDDIVENYLKEVPDDFDFLFLGGVVEDWSHKGFDFLTPSKKIFKAFNVGNTTGYIISKKFYTTFLNYYNDFFYVIDGLTHHQLEPIQDYKMYCCYPTLVDIETNMDSAIKPSHELEWLNDRMYKKNMIWTEDCEIKNFQ